MWLLLHRALQGFFLYRCLQNTLALHLCKTLFFVCFEDFLKYKHFALWLWSEIDLGSVQYCSTSKGALILILVWPFNIICFTYHLCTCLCMPHLDGKRLHTFCCWHTFTLSVATSMSGITWTPAVLCSSLTHCSRISP